MKTKSFELAIYSKGETSSSKLAIVCPGLLDSKEYNHMKSHVDFLADQGFFALSFDPPGTWDSGSNIGSYTISSYLKAVDELIEYFGNKPTVILGHSLGGTISMLSAIRNPYIRAFIAIMSPTILTAARAISKKNKRWKEDGVRIAYRNVRQDADEKVTFNLPYSFVEDARMHDATEGLSKLTKPKLFIAGDIDTSVEPEMAKEAYDISAEPKEFQMIQSDHDYRYHPDLIKEVNQQIVLFLDKYNL